MDEVIRQYRNSWLGLEAGEDYYLICVVNFYVRGNSVYFSFHYSIIIAFLLKGQTEAVTALDLLFLLKQSFLNSHAFFGEDEHLVMCINLLLHKKLPPNSASPNCKHLFIMISVGQEFRSHLARCSDSGSLEVITEILARIAVMQSSEGLPGLKSLLEQWLTHMPDKLVLAVGRIPAALSR